MREPTSALDPRPFALLVLAAFAEVALAQEIVLEPQRLSEHCWFFQGEAGMASLANKGFMSNAGFVVTSDGVVVFDALGTPALGRAMITAIRKVTPQPIKRVVVATITLTTSTDCRSQGARRDLGPQLRRGISDIGPGRRAARAAPCRSWAPVDEKPSPPTSG
jgi:hypothetical protein